MEVKNKIIVYGDLDGLPVINTSEDAQSQETYGIKEKIVSDDRKKRESDVNI